MSATLAGRLVARGTAVTIGALLVVGVATGALLHATQVRALDRALLAAAHAEAHPQPDGRWEVERGRSPVEVWLAEPGDARVPRDLWAEALAARGPTFAEVGDRRLLLLVAEPEHDDDDEDHDHVVVAAAAQRPTLRRTIGVFSLTYAAVALLAALGGALLQRRVVRRALAPLEQAREEAARATGHGAGARLTAQGPAEVRTLIEAMNALLSRLDVAFGAQARFTAEAAHELRTPVTVMLGELDVTLRRARTPEAYREALLTVRESVERLRALVEGLNLLARIDAGQAEQLREPTDAAEVARRAAAAEARALEAAGCPLSIEIAADPVLRVHGALVESALGNLLRNAAAYAPGGPVTLRVEADATRATFTVDDSGPGVPPDAREALFDRFARGGEARRRHRAGLGLGLPLAREVARRHGGDCRLESAPGGGCRAVLTLPIS